MKTFFAFTKKELMEQVRSGRAMILLILFFLLGVMNPAVAKLTPWMLDVLADSLAQSGMTVTNSSVSVMDSWVQFFKNIPMGLIAFVLLQSSIFTREYSGRTLIMSLTKGLERFKVVLSKAAVLTVFWTVCYWLCFSVTYGYNAYFWDNSIVRSLLPSAAFWWLFGIWVVSMMTLFSTVSQTNTGVLLCVGGVVLVSYLVGMLPKIDKYLPTKLADGYSLIYDIEELKMYLASILIAVSLSIICFAVSIPLFNKKHL